MSHFTHQGDLILHIYLIIEFIGFSGGNSLFPVGGGGGKPPKFPTNLSNLRQISLFALEKAVFSPLSGQNFRKFVIEFLTHW
jgi:hypothetical protein